MVLAWCFMLIEYTKVISTHLVWGLGQQNKIFCYVKIFEGGGVRGIEVRVEKISKKSFFEMDKDIFSFACYFSKKV